jgi:hypothetical protein
MPGGLPLGLQHANAQAVGAVTATSLGTTITGSAANNKGSMTQLTASTAFDAVGFTATILGFGATATSGLMDIGIGAAGSEIIIASNLLVSSLTAADATVVYFIPVAIPAGTRIAAKCQTNISSSVTMFVSLILWDGAFTQQEGMAGVDAIGANLTTSQGTVIDPGAVANTKSAYVQLTASTARDYAGFILGFDFGNNTASSAFPAWFVDFAVGGAGSEQIILPNVWVNSEAASPANIMNMTAYGAHVYWFPVPSGTRLAARAQCSSATAAQRTLGVMMYGIYQ